jgi:hypothetical protein
MSEQLELFPQEELQSQGSVNLPQVEPIADAEWCFQFFNNEPVVFAYQTEGTEPSPLNLQIKPEVGESLNFQQNGMMFKVFPRPISEETKLERENASKNKEA